MKRPFQLQWLGFPVILWFLVFLAAPLGLVLLTSFFQRGTYGGIEYVLSFRSYQRAFEWVYLGIFFESLKLAVLTTVSCIVLGFPMAWAMATSSKKMRNVYVLLIAIPFLMNLIIRIYAIRLFLGLEGPFVALLTLFGSEQDPFAFTQNQYVVFYGMVTSYLPFMVFPLYASLEKFDFHLVEASYDLGASSWQILYKLLIPSNRVALANGSLLVFVPSLGEFVIPDLLGGAKNMLVGNLIAEQFLKARDWPFGSALTILLLCVLLFFSWVILKWGRLRGKV